MSQPLWRQNLPAIGVGLIDVFAIGLGMGVPVFAILLGFGVGWWVARSALDELPLEADVPRAKLRSLTLAGVALASASFVVLLVVWGPSVPIVVDPAVDAAAWGIPLILYTSRASKIGWLLLMTVVSPALQFMAVVTGGMLRFALRAKRSGGSR